MCGRTVGSEVRNTVLGCVSECGGWQQVEQHGLRVTAGTYGSCFDRFSIVELDTFDRFVLKQDPRYGATSLDLHAKLLRAPNQGVGQCEIAALTRSEKGAVIVTDDEFHVIDAEPIDKVIDTTGAGDIYAAGFPDR